METANELLRNWRDIKSAQTSKARRQQQQQAVEQAQVVSPVVEALSPTVDRPKITGGPEQTPITPEPYSRPTTGTPSDRYPQDPRYYQAPPFAPSPTPRPPPGAKVAIPPGYPQSYEQAPSVGSDGYPQAPYAVRVTTL